MAPEQHASRRRVALGEWHEGVPLIASDELRHLCERTTAKSSIQASKLQHRVTRTRVKGSKLLEFRRLQRPLDQESPGSSPGGAIGSAIRAWLRSRFCVRAALGQFVGPCLSESRLPRDPHAPGGHGHGGGVHGSEGLRRERCCRHSRRLRAGSRGDLSRSVRGRIWRYLRGESEGHAKSVLPQRAQPTDRSCRPARLGARLRAYCAADSKSFAPIR